MVIPRSRSALSLSRTHAYLKEPLPSSAASCCSVSASSWIVSSRCLAVEGCERGVSGSVHENFAYLVCVPLPHLDKRGVATKAEQQEKGRWQAEIKEICAEMNGDEKNGTGNTDLLELLNGTLVDTTALVDKVAGLDNCQLVISPLPTAAQGNRHSYSRGLAGVDVSGSLNVSNRASKGAATQGRRTQ